MKKNRLLNEYSGSIFPTCFISQVFFIILLEIMPNTAICPD